MTANTWTHVAVTYDANASTLTLYKNGVVVGTSSAAPAFTGNQVQIGAHVASGYFAGSMDEVRIWNVVRTQAQIQASMNSEFCTAQTGLLAYYKFNEGIGSGNNYNVAVAADASGNNNVGTLLNFAAAGGTSNFIVSSSGVAACKNSGCTPTKATITVASTSANYAWHGTTYIANGSYTFDSLNAKGCDSLTTLNLSFVAPGAFSYNTPSTFKTGAAITPLSPNAAAASKPVVTTLSSGIINPSGVAVDAAGNVYVTDYGNNAIKKIATNGTITTVASGIAGLTDVAVDVAGNLYVSQDVNSSIQKIATDGTITSVGSGFSYAIGVAVDATGNVFVADYMNNAVKKIAINGTITTIGSGFNYPADVAVDAVGNVYVADGGNSAVKKIATDGTITTIGSGFTRPTGVTLDVAGNVYVSDQSNNTVKKIATDGTITTLSSLFNTPIGLAVDASGSVYVADYMNNAVKKISFSAVVGTPSKYSISPSLPAGLNIDATTGIISGTPMVVSAAKDYTVTASNGGGSTTSVANITVLFGCTPTKATITVASTTASYTWHGTTYTVDGSYTFDTLNAKGCDSLTTLNLSFPSLKQDNALYFSSTSGVSISNPAAPSTFTVEYRVYLNKTSGEYQGVYYANDKTSESGFYIEATNNVSFWDAGTVQHKSSSTIPFNKWTQVAFTYDGANLKIYIDGKLDATSAAAGLTLPATNITMGYGAGTLFGSYSLGNSALDEFRIWNVARTQAEIQANMNTPLAIPYSSSLVRYFDFNEGVGGANNAGVTTLIDRVSASNGTLNSFALTGNTANWVAVNSLISLPVSLLSFNASFVGDNAVCNWQTTAEVNASKFVVERSIDAINYTPIATINSLGNAGKGNSYQYVDNGVVNEPVVYYRLKTVDKSGNYSYTKIVKIVSAKKQSFSIYPNPAHGSVIINNQVYSSNSSSLLTIRDMAGKIVKTQTLTRKETNVNIGGLKSGVYLVTIQAALGTTTQKMMVQE